ncbi:uncharacterized protein LOC142172493 [Nicotiana tabacum]|uniref:Uncharacterized protein LOC142172493 n=1 Tax=Nicotiana tabacum TaxID=4097 RepID=A0AC58T4R1_TOBAC
MRLIDKWKEMGVSSNRRLEYLEGKIIKRIEDCLNAEGSEGGHLARAYLLLGLRELGNLYDGVRKLESGEGENPSYVKEFRPIACCSTMYKIIAKILTNRLKLIMDLFVGPSQSAFKEERNILDNIIMAHELIKGYSQKAVSPRCMIKVDIRKAYDSVEWSFLKAVRLEFGIPYKMVALIMECVSTVSYTLLLNGGLTDKFVSRKGLSQGTLCPHTYDLLMCCRADEVSMKLMMGVFDHFSKVSGLQTGSHENTHRAPITWETLCKPKAAGGLNIINYERSYKASLTKLLWAIMAKKYKLWIRWIHCHYIKQNDINTMEVPKQASWLVRKLFTAREWWANDIPTIESFVQNGRFNIQKYYLHAPQFIPKSTGKH